MIDITIKDNYFSDVDHIRELGIRCKQWRIADKPETGPGWRGLRSEKFKKLGNEELLQIEKDIFNFIWEERNLKDWKYPSWEEDFPNDYYEMYDLVQPSVANSPLLDPMITTYFHRSPANTVDMLSLIHI